MGVELYSQRPARPVGATSEEVVHVIDPGIDEIDLGELLRKLFSEWKAFLLVMAAGLLMSLVG